MLLINYERPSFSQIIEIGHKSSWSQIQNLHQFSNPKNIGILGGKIFAPFFGSYPLNLPGHVTYSAITTRVHGNATTLGEEHRD